MNPHPVIPRNFAEWRRCIEVDCGIALTPEFVAMRIEALTRNGSEEAHRFASLYGSDHLQRVIGWFHAARPNPPTESLGSA